MTDARGPEAPAVAARLGRDPGIEILTANEVAIRRGHNLALAATEGSGVEAVYALAVLTACDPDDDGVQAIVLCATDERAGRVARALETACGPDGLHVYLAGPGQAGSDSVPDSFAVLVTRPSRLLPAIRSGHIGMGALKLLIMDDISGLSHLDEWASVEPILETLDAEVQRIAATGRPDAEFLALVDRQLPRARRWPAELLPIAAPEEAPKAGGAEIRVAAGSGQDLLGTLQRTVAVATETGVGSVVVHCVEPADAGSVAAALAVAGHRVDTDGSTVTVAGQGDGKGLRASVLYGAPTDLGAFEAAFEDAAGRYAIVSPQHLRHLESLARRAGATVVHVGGDSLTDPLDAVALYRARLEEAIHSVDFVPELLVLEPLIDRFGAVRVAAALSGLLRRPEASADALVPWPDIEAATLAEPTSARHPAGAGSRPASGGRPEQPRGARPAWTKLYFGIGRKEDIRPGDLVGAITGETGIVGGQIGKIDIRGGFSLVEIDSQVVDEVLRKLKGVTIRGQEVLVRPDRDR